MKLKILDENDKRMTFILSGTNQAFANALRRTMLSEVPVMAIESVYFEKNSTGLYDEVISHRLGMIPISFDPKSYTTKSECSCKGKGCSKCQVTFSFDSTKTKLKADEGFLTVMSGDLVSDDKDVKPANDEIPIVEMLEDQELKFGAVASLGTGKMHAKWQAANVGYTLLPSVKMLKADLCEKCLDACPRGVFSEKSGKVSVVNEENCSLCMRCVEVSEPGAISVKGDETSFVFTVESISGLTPRQIMETALDVLENKLKEFVKEIK